MYFAYDFDPQCNYGNRKNKGYFGIFLSINLVLINNNNPLKYLEEKKSKDIKYLKMYKKDENRIYFYEVKLDDDKINTVLYRLPTNGNKKGIVVFIFLDYIEDIIGSYSDDRYEEHFDDDEGINRPNNDKNSDKDDDKGIIIRQTNNEGNILFSKIKYLLLIFLMFM